MRRNEKGTPSALAMLLYFDFFCQEYHAVCAEAREAERRRLGLYEGMGEGMGEGFSHRQTHKPWSYLDYVVFPIAGTFFGNAPLLQAALAHFRSEKLV